MLTVCQSPGRGCTVSRRVSGPSVSLLARVFWQEKGEICLSESQEHSQGWPLRVPTVTPKSPHFRDASWGHQDWGKAASFHLGHAPLLGACLCPALCWTRHLIFEMCGPPWVSPVCCAGETDIHTYSVKYCGAKPRDRSLQRQSEAGSRDRVKRGCLRKLSRVTGF